MKEAEKPLPVVLLRSVLWRGLEAVSLQHCRLLQYADGYIIDGRVLTVHAGQPAEAQYSILCDRDWQTQHAHVAVIQGAVTRQVQLRRDAQSQWWQGADRIPDLDGMVDIDLSVSPSTNTLPIRRLDLEIGESRSTDAAWIRFPELTLERLGQHYTRLDEYRYRYESNGGAFTTEIEVDDAGVVVRYGDLWERVAP